MSSNRFPAPPVAPVMQQHEVADPANAERLLQAIPPMPESLSALQGKHIVSVRHFETSLIRQLMRFAASVESEHFRTEPTLSGKVMGTNFLTGSPPDLRLSFEKAWMSMGGGLLDLGPAGDEIVRTQRDPAEIAALNNNYCDLAVVRTSESALLSHILKYSCVPVINAGDGDNEAPTQALADLYTIFKWRPELLGEDVPREKRLQIGIFGNPSNTGSIRSLLFGFALFPQAIDRIVLMERLASAFSGGQREALEQAGLRIVTASELCPQDTVRECNAKIIPELDIIYSHLKLQPSVSRMGMLELKSFFKPNLLLMSPHRQLPESSALVNDSPHNGFYAQAKAGVLLRMAVMRAVMD